MMVLRVISMICLAALVNSKIVEIIKNDKITLNVKYDKTQDNGSGWWKKAVIYQIYVRSFMDSDGDGNGDLRGIVNKIDHFADVGVNAIWLSPIYVSPQVDGGYDVADYCTIDKTYGNMTDFMDLIQQAHNSNIKVILDFVPNHSSDQHQWFNKSLNKEEGYEDYYVWRDGNKNKDGSISPPNNWLSVFNGPMWKWSDVRKQYYLHQFTEQQPDLNLSNPKVVQEFKDIMTYWLDMGVDGFRIDAVPHFVEDPEFRDEPENVDTNLNTLNDYNALNHIYTKDQNGSYEVIYQFREYIDNYTATHNGSERIFMTEAATDIDHVVLYYGNTDGSRLGAHFSFNFWLEGLDQSATPENIILLIAAWKETLPSSYTQNWLLGNHDNPRVATRVGKKNVDGYNMLISFLDGVMISYMGEEIGQENGNVTCKQGQDPSAIGNCSTFDEKSRDFERTPFQWDNTTNAGFSTANTTWLPVAKNYKEINLADQKAQNRSHYKVYQKITSVRELYGVDEALRVQYLGQVKDKILFVMRVFQLSEFNSAPYYIFVFNMGDNTVSDVDLSGKIAVEQLEIIASSVNAKYTVGDVIKYKNITLAPGDSLIVKPHNSTQIFN